MNVFLTPQSLRANYLQVLNGGKLQSIWMREISPPCPQCNILVLEKGREGERDGRKEELR